MESNNSTIFILLLVLFTSCEQSKNVEEGFYSSGSLMFQVELKNGLREGLYSEYFETGKIKAVLSYNKGRLNGVAKYYFDDGKLELLQHWKNGKLNGLVEVYYKSGTVRSSGTFFNDLQIGTHSFYYEDGSIMEIDKYDSLGNAMDYEKYDSLGQLRIEAKDAITFLKNDTLKLGESVTLTGHLGNNKFNVNMIIGERYNENGFLEDTLATVFPLSDVDGCVFDFKPAKTGEGFLVGYIQEIHNMSDSSITVQLYPFLERYFVTQP